MKSQMLDFVIFLSEKVQDRIVEQLTKFYKMIIHGGRNKAHQKSPTGSLGQVDFQAGQVFYFTLLNLLHVIT